MNLRFLAPWAVFGLVCYVLGILTSQAVLIPEPDIVIETPTVATALPPAPASPNGGIVAAREPVAVPNPAQSVPKDMTVERTGSVTVKPKPAKKPATKPKMQPTAVAAGGSGAAPPASPEEALCECRPLKVDVTLASGDDGSHLLFSSPEGEIVSATDHPVIKASAAPLRWAAGGAIMPGSGRYGAWATRDVFGPVVAGGMLLQNRDGGAEPWIVVGFRF